MRNTSKILDMLSAQTVQSLDHQIKRFQICKTVCPQTLPDMNQSALKKNLQAHEIALIEMWNTLDTPGFSNEMNAMFVQTCKKCVDMMSVMPIPEKPIDRCMHIIKMISYAYLGDRWEDVRRYMNDFWEDADVYDLGWNGRVLVNVCRAVIYLARKESPCDLDHVKEIVKRLRTDQRIFERDYIESMDGEKIAAADELAALYHMAKSVELVGEFMMQGTPSDVETQVDFHLEHAKRHAQISGYVEIDIILFVLHAALKKMLHNSIWNLAKAIPHLAEFIEDLARSESPVFEFMQPQSMALDEGLLDSAKMAVVVNLPTSSGKTLMAEFRILQTLNTSRNAKIAYIVPTKALVNQISSRLRRDLGKLGIRIEKMSGAVEIGEFEENLVLKSDFQVLVTTPEKLHLIIRRPDNDFTERLALTIVDEAHNMADKNRGFNLELLLSTIKHDCDGEHFLLMSPSIPNSSDLARWLNPASSKAISMTLDNWTPNDRIVGTCYKAGRGRKLSTFFKPLLSNRKEINMDEILIKQMQESPYAASSIRKYELTALLSAQLGQFQNLLILVTSISDTWQIADEIVAHSRESEEPSPEVRLVMKFVASEMGADFPLIKYLEKKIAVHHAGLPDDVRSLVEWLMENGCIRTLVATSTIAEGINFPVSGMLIHSYKYYNEELNRSKPMPVNDFLNLIGRVGRIDQSSIGMVGIVSTESDARGVLAYVKQATDDLVSHLIDMVKDAYRVNRDLDLPSMADNPNWSRFLQYVAHIKNQSESLSHFDMRIDSALMGTYGYAQISPDRREVLKNAVRRYARKLEAHSDLALISDMTGFAPENVGAAIREMAKVNLDPEDWLPENLFDKESRLPDLITIMARSIPEVVEVKKWMYKYEKNEVDVAMFVKDWVLGLPVENIAVQHFGSDKDDMTTCVRSIYKIITNAVTWGIAGIQKIPDSGTDRMTGDEKRRASNIPGMIHYGVYTGEAVLMRMNNVPRRIAIRLGKLYQNTKPDDVFKWLDNLPDNEWCADDVTGTDMSGTDYKKIWKILTGNP
ncbi:MAG: DEAD/DEAH box helicase [Candidatus Poribacteria bacterium]|nr:DEAD/DEAH box helicase [Candidatus Poribacteria bacterium]